MDTHQARICNCVAPPHSKHSGGSEVNTLDSETAGMFFSQFRGLGSPWSKTFGAQAVGISWGPVFNEVITCCLFKREFRWTGQFLEQLISAVNPLNLESPGDGPLGMLVREHLKLPEVGMPLWVA